MIGVVIPVHNEEELLASCLAALVSAARDPELNGEDVQIVVVLDDCSDGSAEIAGRFDVTVRRGAFRNVGMARALGAEIAIDRGARWLAFTDADSQVPPDWLSTQLDRKVDAVCGIVEVGDWTGFSRDQRTAYESTYDKRDGHRHIHGANLGVCTRSYVRAGGFTGLARNEDVQLVRSLENIGAKIAWVAAPCVRTDSRIAGRLRGGFACFLRELTRAPSGSDLLIPAADPAVR